MRIIICLLLMTQICSAQVALYRYTDKTTGEERGQCYSGNDGTPAVTNPNWDMEVIDESQKEYYKNLYRQQSKDKYDADKALIDKEKATVRTKLKTLGISDKEIDTLLGETKNIIPVAIP